MGLKAIEQKIESLFEGLFGRAFRTNVQPVEIARKLAKEMDEHRTVSVSRVYAPNEYTVYLSSGDREQFSGYENSLQAELEEYLSEHATREGYALLTPVRVLLETDDDLALGEFGIAARMVQPRHGHRRGARGAGRARGDDDLHAARGARVRRRARRAGIRRRSALVGRPQPADRGPARPSSAARATATCRSRTRTSRAATRSCAGRTTASGSSISTRRTASRWTAGASSARSSTRATRSRSDRPR